MLFFMVGYAYIFPFYKNLQSDSSFVHHLSFHRIHFIFLILFILYFRIFLYNTPKIAPFPYISPFSNKHRCMPTFNFLLIFTFTFTFLFFRKALLFLLTPAIAALSVAGSSDATSSTTHPSTLPFHPSPFSLCSVSVFVDVHAFVICRKSPGFRILDSSSSFQECSY